MQITIEDFAGYAGKTELAAEVGRGYNKRLNVLTEPINRLVRFEVVNFGEIKEFYYLFEAIRYFNSIEGR